MADTAQASAELAVIAATVQARIHTDNARGTLDDLIADVIDAYTYPTLFCAEAAS